MDNIDMVSPSWPAFSTSDNTFNVPHRRRHHHEHKQPNMDNSSGSSGGGGGGDASMMASLSSASSSSNQPVPSQGCLLALRRWLFTYEDSNSQVALALAYEGSSHPAGLAPLFAQPYLYAGPGLGSGQECYYANVLLQQQQQQVVNNNTSATATTTSVTTTTAALTHTCLAGTRRDALNFARLCIVAPCTARDVAAPDFAIHVQQIAYESSQRLNAVQYNRTMDVMMRSMNNSNNNTSVGLDSVTLQQFQLQDEARGWGDAYAVSIQHMTEVGSFLGTSWICGMWQADWIQPASVLYAVLTATLMLLVLWGTLWRRRVQHNCRRNGVNLRSFPIDNQIESAPVKSRDTFFVPFKSSLPTSARQSLYPGEGTALLDSSPARMMMPQSNFLKGQDDEVEPPPPTACSTILSSASDSCNSSTSSTTHAAEETCFLNTSPTQGMALIAKHGISCDETSLSGQQPQPPLPPLVRYGCVRRSNWYECVAEAFDMSHHVQVTMWQSAGVETACLHGIRAMSVLWIILGHVMAVWASAGPGGWINPASVLPPTGWLRTLPGQIIFASRFAVDTFFCLSGFLAVHVLQRKWDTISTKQQMSMAESNQSSGYDPEIASSTTRGRRSVRSRRCRGQMALWYAVVCQYVQTVPKLIVARAARILPLYMWIMGFYILVAPHVGSGPFWYEWMSLLKPCLQNSGWLTNVLFINNFIPMHTPVTDTCFYHSWYLAVDMQLFLFAPLLVCVHQAAPRYGRRSVLALFAVLISITLYLTASRHWSLNTFDGAAVARYDIEAYAKPHIRAPSYLTGMYVSMCLPAKRLQESPRACWTWKHDLARIVAITIMTFVGFATAFGAYDQRPCLYQEWPDQAACGTSWPFWPTSFLYTALSPTAWTVSVAIILYLCLGFYHEHDVIQDERYEVRPQQKNVMNGTGDRVRLETVETLTKKSTNIIGAFLSWKGWVPLSHLSFAAYLIHPIVLFVWLLQSEQKPAFSAWNLTMMYLSVCIVTFAAALVSALLVEFPLAALWKQCIQTPPKPRSN